MSRVNIIEEDDFRPIIQEEEEDSVVFLGANTTQALRRTRRIPRAVTPERRPFQYVPVFSSYYEDEEHFVHVIGVFDSQISACHATIRWMIENDRGFDPESEAWGDNDYSPEEAIGILTRNTINWDNVEAYAYRFGNGYYNEPRGWYLQLQIF